MSAVVGIDFSTHAVDLVTLDETDDTAIWERIPLEGETAWDRLLDWRNITVAGWDDVFLAAIEFPTPDQRRVLAQMQGAIVARIPGRVPVWQFKPSEWRRACWLPGNASKGAVARFAVLRWRNVPDVAAAVRLQMPQDAYDAFCIAWAARELNRTALNQEES